MPDAPFEADFRYHAGVFGPEESAAHLGGLVAETAWEERTFSIMGRTMPMPRLIHLYGPRPYRYSGVHHPAEALPPRVEALRLRAEAIAGVPLNSVLLNYYRDERDSVGWHHDADYEGHPVIAALSFGATRSLHLRARRGRARGRIDLASGSVLVMGPGAQERWLHALPKQAAPCGPRVSLTFRYMT
jgi:alkylated DNA repair dioxygenase AlkB